MSAMTEFQKHELNDPKPDSHDLGESHHSGNPESPHVKAREMMYAFAAPIDPSKTRLTTEEKFAEAQAKEIFRYAIFLLLFSISALWGESTQDYFWFREQLREQLIGNEFPPNFIHVKKTMMDSASTMDMIQYINGVFYPYVYSSYTFDSDQEYAQNIYNTSNEPGFLLGYGEIVGKIRIGQIRVKPDKCSTSDKIRHGDVASNTFQKCYPEFGYSEEDKEPFGRDPSELYSYARDKSEPDFVSTATTETYPPPAFEVLLPRTEPVGVGCPIDLSSLEWPDPKVTDSPCLAGRELAKMRWNKWIDLQTRAIYVDINVFSHTLDRMAICRMFFELRAGGGVVPSVDVELMRPYPYSTARDYVFLALDVVVLMFVLAYLVVECQRIGREKFKYISLGNIPHFLNLILFMVVWGYRIASLVARPPEIDVLSQEFVDLRRANDNFKIQRSINSFNIFLSWVKVFKYLAFLPQFAQVTRTLAMCAPNLGGFFLVIAIVLFGSAQAFTLAFGNKMADFRNLRESMFSLIRALLMDFNLEDLREANLWLGPIMFGAFILIAVFVLLNMFIAIISDAYTETKEDLDKEIREGRIVWPYMKEYFRKMCMRVPGLAQVVDKFYSAKDEDIKEKDEQYIRARDQGMRYEDWCAKQKSEENQRKDPPDSITLASIGAEEAKGIVEGDKVVAVWKRRTGRVVAVLEATVTSVEKNGSDDVAEWMATLKVAGRYKMFSKFKRELKDLFASSAVCKKPHSAGVGRAVAWNVRTADMWIVHAPEDDEDVLETSDSDSD